MAEGAPAGCGSGMQFGVLIAAFVVFYFVLIRPQQKRQQEHESMLKSLRRHMVVRTTGGVRGEITDLNDRDATLMIADKVKINVLRTHIAGIEPSEQEKAEASEAKKASKGGKSS